MPRKKAPQFRCKKCGQSFKMAMHLGRHLSTIHGRAAAKRPAKRPGKRRLRRIAHRIDVQALPADELVVLLKAVREEANRRLEGLRQAIG